MAEIIVGSILRTIVAFVLLIILARVLGRKVISQMTFFDFAIGVTIGSVVANIGLGANRSSIAAITILITMSFLASLTGYLNLKSFSLRKLIASEPVVLIENNRIIDKNLRKVHLTLTELMMLLREKNIFNVGDVEFALMEFDGKLSVLPKSQKQPLTPSDMKLPTTYVGLTKDIVLDGRIMSENLRDITLDENWLFDQLAFQGIHDIREVFYAGLDSSGKLYVSKVSHKLESHGQHGIE